MSFSEYIALAKAHPRETRRALLNLLPFVGAVTKTLESRRTRRAGELAKAIGAYGDENECRWQARFQMNQARAFYAGAVLASTVAFAGNRLGDRLFAAGVLIAINGATTMADFAKMKDEADRTAALAEARRRIAAAPPTPSSADRSQSR